MKHEPVIMYSREWLEHERRKASSAESDSALRFGYDGLSWFRSHASDYRL